MPRPLGREARLKDASDQRPRHTWTGVSHLGADLAVSLTQTDGDLATRLSLHRIKSVLNQVTGDRREHFAQAIRRPQAAARRHRKRDAPLRCNACLAHQQRHQPRIGDACRQIVDPLLLFASGLRNECHRLIVPAELQHPSDGVQLVDELVRLCAQGIGVTSRALQLTRQLLQLRLVAEGGDGADEPVPNAHRDPADHDRPTVELRRLVRLGLARAQDARQAGIRNDLANRPAFDPLRQAE